MKIWYALIARSSFSWVSRAETLLGTLNQCQTKPNTQMTDPQPRTKARNEPAANDPLAAVERPVPAGTNAAGFGSDVAAEALRALDVPYIALNPGASYRGLHDSLVNHLGNAHPQMLLCLHEEHAVAIAHGYAKVTGRAMAEQWGLPYYKFLSMPHPIANLTEAQLDQRAREMAPQIVRLLLEGQS